MKKRRPVRFLLITLHVLLGAALILAVFSPQISPKTLWPFAFLGLFYPILLASNLILSIYWAIRRDRFFLPALGIFILGCSPLGQFIQVGYADSDDVSDGHEQIRVMSYNIRLFDYYNWTNRKETKDSMLLFLEQDQADIFCFQEFFAQDTTIHITEAEVIKRLGKARHAHIEYTAYVEKHKQHFGIATFSAYPIVNKGVISSEKSSNNICIFTDVVMHHDTVRIYNMHLQSIHFQAKDYQFLEKLEEGEGQLEDSKRIVSKLRDAFVRRARQAEQIHGHMQQCPYPMIVCGDFNDSPISYAYRTISDGLQDSFLEKGYGWGKTYAGIFPGVRIDYILHNDYFRTTGFQIMPKRYSDHFPVEAVLEPVFRKTK
ncbi:MAG: endonuclease/exonuclease/phosphatase family protein [Flavobacteriales bacterium]|nr:endonuclease/exonuclease/phosphatase family protein [Flavobacteriales bacterium]